MFVDYYEVLAIDPRADAAAIKAAYRARIVRDHVDQNPDDPAAKERTIVLAQAKQTLLDEQRRRAFDQQRAFWLATRHLPPRWTQGTPTGNAPQGTGPAVEVDLRDVSLGKLIVGAGVAVLLGGLFVAAKAVADRRQSSRRR
ncbi:DnaJ domain-containing protein [Nannocystaceae bacterium ST9]